MKENENRNNVTPLAAAKTPGEYGPIRSDRVSKTIRMYESKASLDELLSMVTRPKKMSELLLPHVGERTIKSICDLAVISTALWYRIMNNTVRPGMDVLLRLAFVLEMNVEETQSLLKSGRCALLSSEFPRDVAIIYGLKNELNLGEMDTVLEQYGFDPLVQPEK